MNPQTDPDDLPIPDEDEPQQPEGVAVEDESAQEPASAAQEDAAAAAAEAEPGEAEDESREAVAEEPQAGEVAEQEPAFDIAHIKRVLEAALLSTPEPLSVQQLRRLFAGQVQADDIRKLLDQLRDEWAERPVELTAVASGWRFRVKPQYQEFIDRITNEKPPRYSRAVLETLAIVAYRQPVTRGDIEEIRGVAVSPPTLKALEERGWIETVGHRETPGRPALFATTRKFLDDLNLRSLEELPPLDELQSALEPAQSLVPLEAAPPPPQQESLIEDEPDPTEAQTEDEAPQESDAHAG